MKKGPEKAPIFVTVRQCAEGKMVRSRRLELPQHFCHSDLNAARLPIPPRPRLHHSNGLGAKAQPIEFLYFPKPDVTRRRVGMQQLSHVESNPTTGRIGPHAHPSMRAAPCYRIRRGLASGLNPSPPTAPPEEAQGIGGSGAETGRRRVHRDHRRVQAVHRGPQDRVRHDILLLNRRDGGRQCGPGAMPAYRKRLRLPDGNQHWTT